MHDEAVLSEIVGDELAEFGVVVDNQDFCGEAGLWLRLHSFVECAATMVGLLPIRLIRALLSKQLRNIGAFEEGVPARANDSCLR